jgi:pimeloyl-ACP methyl ester carboxylesterase
MQLQLIHFKTNDHLTLPGILYEPDSKTNKVAIYLHGNGTSSVFYDPTKNILGKQLADIGIAFFPFNNRGANLIKSLKKETQSGEERVLYGTAYEIIKECILDINSAISLLKEKGYSEFYLIGESTGANKIVVYNYYQQSNPVSKYILLSGGDDTGLYYNEFGKEKFKKILEISKKMIRDGHGTELISRELYESMPMSYQSMYDTINPDGDYNIFPFNETLNNLKLSKKELFLEYKTIHKPTLVVYGNDDEYCYGKVPECVEILRKNTSDPELFQYKIIENADHGFHGKETELFNIICNFLAK